MQNSEIVKSAKNDQMIAAIPGDENVNTDNILKELKDEFNQEHKTSEKKDLTELTEMMGNLTVKEVEFQMPKLSAFYNDEDQNLHAKLKEKFKDVNVEELTTLELSGNSYGFEACKWIAENILSKAQNLRKCIFSDIFTTRLRNTLPQSLVVLIQPLMDKNIISIDLAHNAFGPDGVTSFMPFLESIKTLKVLNVTNCGLGPKGGQMIAESILKNEHMQLLEFYASRDRLEEEGLKALAKVFSKQKCLQKIEVYTNGSKYGLKDLL